MKSSHRVRMTLAIFTMATSAIAFGKFIPGGDDTAERGIPRRSPVRAERYYDEAPADVRSASLVQPATRSSAVDTPSALPTWRQSRGPDLLDSERDPRTPRNREMQPSQTQGSEQTRNRVSLISGSNSQAQRGFSGTGRDRLPGDRHDARLFRDRPLEHSLKSGRSREGRNGVYSPGELPELDPSLDGNQFSTSDPATIRSQDPFIPAPHPNSQLDIESSAIDRIITSRYQNPVTVRAIRAMSSSQAVELFSEVSQKIDERSLDPTSYDVRVRRALRNLTIALDNTAFLTGLGLSENSFRLDGFRNTLGRLAGARPVQNFPQASRTLSTVMTESHTVNGLTPGVVGFEFANASIDTLDEFSGLEPADPALRRAVGKGGHKSDVLEEQIVGIGLEVREHAEGLIVVKPLRGGPAAEAGIEPGDLIHSIDGQDIHGMKIVNSMDLLKGPSGSRMTIGISRDDSPERDVVLIRRTVQVWTVNDVRILSGTDVGYFSLSRFSRNSTAEVDQALNRLHNMGMRSLIIDLRGNPGGLLTTCVEISDRFVACGVIVSTKGRLETDNMLEEAVYTKTWSIPLVVLVDGDSASASEIFAAAIQENDRGLVVGARSYGKGSVQTHFPLSSIEGDLRLTTALFYSPTGRRMAGRGVTPDFEVDDPDGVLSGDKVLHEALDIAQGEIVKDIAKTAGACRTRNPPAVRSSSLDDIVDPAHPGTTIL